jgi:hypothetical protein
MKREKIAGFVNIFGTSFSYEEIERLFNKSAKLGKTFYDVKGYLKDALFSFDFEKYSIATYSEDYVVIAIVKFLKGDKVEIVEFTDIDEVFDAFYSL